MHCDGSVTDPQLPWLLQPSAACWLVRRLSQACLASAKAAKRPPLAAELQYIGAYYADSDWPGVPRTQSPPSAGRPADVQLQFSYSLLLYCTVKSVNSYLLSDGLGVRADKQKSTVTAKVIVESQAYHTYFSSKRRGAIAHGNASLQCTGRLQVLHYEHSSLRPGHGEWAGGPARELLSDTTAVEW
jgi:hypothetical protein